MSVFVILSSYITRSLSPSHSYIGLSLPFLSYRAFSFAFLSHSLSLFSPPLSLLSHVLSLLYLNIQHCIVFGPYFIFISFFSLQNSVYLLLRGLSRSIRHGRFVCLYIFIALSLSKFTSCLYELTNCKP